MRMLRRFALPPFALALFLLLPFGCAHNGARPPTSATVAVEQAPIAARKPFTVTSPNGNRQDDWYWLRDDTRKDPEILAYLGAENAWYAKYRDAHAPLVETINSEIVGRIKQDDMSAPVLERGWWYYTRYETGSEYPILARRKASMDAAEQIMLDGNALAVGHEFFQIAGTAVSDDGHLLAYAVDTVGRRQFEIHLRDLRTGKDLPDTITQASSDFAWAADNRTLFYVETDPVTLLTVRVKRHVLGSDPAADVLVYEEKDPSFYIGVGRTSDHRYLTIALGSTTTGEVRYLRSDRPTEPLRVLAPRERDHEYGADHIDNRWIIRSNWQATNFRLLEVRDGREGDKKRWKQVVAHSDAIFIEGFHAFRGFLAIDERSDALKRVRVRNWNGSNERYVGADEAAYVAEIGDNREQQTDWLRYEYSSLTTPQTTYELNVKTGERKLIKREPVLGGFDPARYVSERIWAPARDGTKVPVTLLHTRDFRRDGSAPLLQYGYGAYGISMDPRFNAALLSLVDRGVVYAIAHIRGGQELGRSWYENGKLLNKKNTFTDFIDVTHYLVAENYAARDKVAAIGGSAGGLLMGAVANMAAQDYTAMIALVPFVDVVTTMLDESIPLTTNEFDEWGNPKQKASYDYMLSYSPVDNISAQAYPAMLVITGLWDSQVQYFEPAKWVARLRATKTDSNPLLFKINMEAGHGGKSGRLQRYRDTAESYVFLLDRFGLGK